MENSRLKEAIDDSDRWFNSSKILYKEEIYDKALYALEMSLEIAIKAFLIANEIDFPKSHRVADALLISIKEKYIIDSKDFAKSAEKIADVFQSLLDYRNASAYTFDSRITMDEFKKKCDEKFSEVEKARRDLKNEINRMVGKNAIKRKG